MSVAQTVMKPLQKPWNPESHHTQNRKLFITKPDLVLLLNALDVSTQHHEKKATQESHPDRLNELGSIILKNQDLRNQLYNQAKGQRGPVYTFSVTTESTNAFIEALTDTIENDQKEAKKALKNRDKQLKEMYDESVKRVEDLKQWLIPQYQAFMNRQTEIAEKMQSAVTR
jgi:hypothetical protein